MERKELEIMAPAGNFECLRAAIQGGADSVYFGVGHLNMRSHSANNFQPEDLSEVVRICREAGVKSYMTLNIVLYQEDLEPMRKALDAALAAGVDAIIASDMAAISYCRKIGLEVHISTQRIKGAYSTYPPQFSADTFPHIPFQNIHGLEKGHRATFSDIGYETPPAKFTTQRVNHQQIIPCLGGIEDYELSGSQ